LNPSVTSGVCGTCEYDGSCVYEANSGSVILDCGEFEPGMPAAEARQPSTREMAASPASTESEQASEYLGLCCNCENRKGCTHPKPEGGVWFCQEYV
jgi:hypothetical protein